MIKVLRQYIKWAFKPKAALRIFESKTFHLPSIMIFVDKLPNFTYTVFKYWFSMVS